MRYIRQGAVKKSSDGEGYDWFLRMFWMATELVFFIQVEKKC